MPEATSWSGKVCQHQCLVVHRCKHIRAPRHCWQAHSIRLTSRHGRLQGLSRACQQHLASTSCRTSPQVVARNKACNMRTAIESSLLHSLSSPVLTALCPHLQALLAAGQAQSWRVHMRWLFTLKAKAAMPPCRILPRTQWWQVRLCAQVGAISA